MQWTHFTLNFNLGVILSKKNETVVYKFRQLKH